MGCPTGSSAIPCGTAPSWMARVVKPRRSNPPPFPALARPTDPHHCPPLPKRPPPPRPPAPDTLGGFDGLGVTIVGLSLPGSVVVDSRVIVVVRAGVEYLLNCQSTSAHADAIGEGCRQVIDSFTLG